MPFLSRELKQWLAFYRQVFQTVFQEFEEHKVVVLDRSVPFACNDCGRCCYTQDMGTFVYQYDIERMINGGAFLPLCCIFPQEDEWGTLSYALPSKREWQVAIEELPETMQDEPGLIEAYLQVDRVLARLNPDLRVLDDSCIFYANSKPHDRCLIYDVRPTGCRVYPFDRFKISHVEVPPELQEKYQILEENPRDQFLYCDPECFTRTSTLKYKRIREDIVADKINAILSIEVPDEFADIDFATELFRTFYPRLLDSKKEGT
jgi:Fe-S-cluster containining protein